MVYYMGAFVEITYCGRTTLDSLTTRENQVLTARVNHFYPERE